MNKLKFNLNWQNLSSVHYALGGFLGVLIFKLIYGELSVLNGILAFIFWPFVFAFGAFVLLTQIITFIIGLIF